MKKITAFALVLCMIFPCAACTDEPEGEELPLSPPSDGKQIYIIVDSELFTATLAKNETAEAFARKLPMTIDMRELNGNEKYKYLSDDLPDDPKSAGTIQTGDIMLYGSNCVVLFYETFSSSYSYTRIGWVNEPARLAQALGDWDVMVTFALTSEEDVEDPDPTDGEEDADDIDPV